MIEGYIDETGIHQDAALCVVCGFFGGKGQWKRFEREWRRALAAYDVPLEEFHALNLLKRRKYFFKWSDDELNGLLGMLTHAIAAHKVYPVTHAIDIAAFNSFPEIHRRFFTGAELRNRRLTTSGCPNKPYFTPFQKCIKRIASYAPIGGKAHYFCGLDRPFSKYAGQLYRMIKTARTLELGFRDRLGDIAFPLAKETPQLQAADLLAYLTFQHLAESMALGAFSRPAEGWLKQCLVNTRMNDDHSIIDVTSLTESRRMTHEWAGNWDGVVDAFEYEDEQDLPA